MGDLWVPAVLGARGKEGEEDARGPSGVAGGDLRVRVRPGSTGQYEVDPRSSWPGPPLARDKATQIPRGRNAPTVKGARMTHALAIYYRLLLRGTWKRAASQVG